MQEKPSHRLRLLGKVQVMLGSQHSKGLWSRQSQTQLSGWAQKELQKKPQAMGNPGLRSPARWPCTRCSCSASAPTERTLLASASPVLTVTLHLAERARQDSCPQKLHKQVQQFGLRQSFQNYFEDPRSPSLSPSTCACPLTLHFQASRQLSEG